MLTRGKQNNKILILNTHNQEELLDKDTFLKNSGVDGIIRIPEEEYKNIDFSLPYFAHFNLEFTNHVSGNKYGLIKILRNGYFDEKTGKQILPLLDLGNIYKAECVEAKNFIDYKDLTEEHFKYSMQNIKTATDLKEKIVKRYSKSLPGLTRERILSLGVGFTLLKI